MNLQELEQKYHELGKEIERLKNSEVQYPIYCRSLITNVIVKFSGINEGTVIKSGTSHDIPEQTFGFVYDGWTDHTDKYVWQQLKLCPKTGFYDGQLVWCWDRHSTHERVLRFYDVKNRRVFCGQGKRGGWDWNNYEAFKGDYPYWAHKAFETLDIGYE